MELCQRMWIYMQALKLKALVQPSYSDSSMISLPSMHLLRSDLDFSLMNDISGKIAKQNKIYLLYWGGKRGNRLYVFYSVFHRKLKKHTQKRNRAFTQWYEKEKRLVHPGRNLYYDR